MSTFDDLRSSLAHNVQQVDVLKEIYEGAGIEWEGMDILPTDLGFGFGYFRVKARVFDEIMVIYSTWTGCQWVNCFPVQERLGWEAGG
jgi:hypothetical protein